MSFFVNVEITVWCESVKRGCTFSARITEGSSRARWYSGQGDTAFEAVAWALDEYVRRGILEHEPSLARNANAKPGEGLHETPRRARRITPAPAMDDGPATAATESGQCFEQQIPRRPAPQLFGATPRTTAPAKRRARGGRH